VSKISEINVPSGAESQNQVEQYRIPKKPTLKLPRRSIKKIRKNQAEALADKVFRQRKKPKNLAKKNRFCKTCNISCNSAKTFYDHIHSKGHKSRRESEKVPPECLACNRDFESHNHLARHLKSKAHFKIVSKIH
jgi:Zinc-finger double-stranded RNA-binding/Zinc-finger of C2H2 type